ncbi:MAG: hypothetical protein JWM95_3306 [Gemmatimonadetes bacterium]|nr:hypothetical protein [Gemmatimonadota bacterium]
MRRILFLALAVASGCLPARAQRTADSDDRWLENCRDNWGDRDRGRACEVRDVAVRVSGRFIEVDGQANGGVRVVGWDGSDVKVTARLQGNARSDGSARDLLKDVRIGMDGNTLRADGPRGWSGRGRDSENWSVSYLIMVPRHFDLRLGANNGSLNVAGVNGTMDLRTTNGSVVLSEVGGDVRARTQNGSLTVELSGGKWEGAGLEAQTQNGAVRMGIPSKYAATIETGTVNGHVSTDFPVTFRGRITRQLSLPLNGGGTVLRATTQNGSVTLSER